LSGAVVLLRDCSVRPHQDWPVGAAFSVGSGRWNGCSYLSNRQETTMSEPTKVEREALLELLLDLGGPLCWTGPIPYDALAARHAVAHRQVKASQSGDLGVIPSQSRASDSTVAA
jgi:hypothetical protein